MRELQEISEPLNLLRGIFSKVPDSHAHILLLGLAYATSLRENPRVEDAIATATETITLLVGNYGNTRASFEKELSSWLSILLEDGYYPLATSLYTLYQKSAPPTACRLRIKIPKSVPEEWAVLFR